MANVKLGLLSAFIFGVMSFQVNAQHSLSLQGGASVPAGDLARTQTGYFEQSGHASTGYGLGLQYTYQLHELIGIVANGSYQAFPVDQDAIERQIGVGYNFTFTEKPDYHRLWTAMAGPALTFTSSPFKARLKIQAGYMRLSMTGFEYNFTLNDPNSSPEVIEQSSNTGGSFGYQTGVDFRYALTPQFGINLSANLVYGRFDEQLSLNGFGPGGDQTPTEGPSTISAIQPMLGLSANL